MLLLVVLVLGMALTPLHARAVTPNELQSKIGTIRSSLSSLATQLAAAEAALDKASDAIARHTRTLRSAGSRLAVLSGSFARRTADLYINADAEVFEALMTSADLETFTDRLGFLEQVRAGEKGMLEELTALRRRAGLVTTELQQAQRAERSARDSLVARRRALDAKLHEYQSLLNLATLGRSSGRASRSLPGFQCPVRGGVAFRNGYGEPRRGGPHTGIDLVADSGQPAVAVLPSVVVAEPRGWMGIGLIIRDAAGNEWWYAHMGKKYAHVGDRVAGGELIGRVGCTGNCTGPHLHFEYHPGGGDPRNPYRILRSAC